MGSSKTAEYPVIWLQAATCTGCAVSALNSVSPTIKNVLIDEVIPGKHISLKFMATVMAGQGDAVIEAMEDTARIHKGGFILIIEGAIPTANNGAYGAIGERDGAAVSIVERVTELSHNALAVLALGTCSSFGGIPAAKPNPTNCVSVRKFFADNNIAKPLINIPGCPPHPDWFIGTVAGVLLKGLPAADELDDFLRPKAFYGKLVHENCPRRAYFDEGKFARKFGDPGCLNELGCKGPVTSADCPLRMWNHGANWCINAGSPCIGCCEPGFPDLMAPLYQKLTGELIPEVALRKK